MKQTAQPSVVAVVSLPALNNMHSTYFSAALPEQIHCIDHELLLSEVRTPRPQLA